MYIHIGFILLELSMYTRLDVEKERWEKDREESKPKFKSISISSKESARLSAAASQKNLNSV
jgi:hypothetical protein